MGLEFSVDPGHLYEFQSQNPLNRRHFRDCVRSDLFHVYERLVKHVSAGRLRDMAQNRCRACGCDHGTHQLQRFFLFPERVSLTIPESAKPKLFKRMRAVINTSAIPGVILGTIVLAVTANLIELLCTAGFPAIYTNILTSQNLSVVQYYFYLMLYNVIYVIPLAVIVAIFAWKMGGRKMTEKEGRILKLAGGLLMLALGFILLIKPELLMFG